jgi:hypothetical protein
VARSGARGDSDSAMWPWSGQCRAAATFACLHRSTSQPPTDCSYPCKAAGAREKRELPLPAQKRVASGWFEAGAPGTGGFTVPARPNPSVSLRTRWTEPDRPTGPSRTCSEEPGRRAGWTRGRSRTCCARALTGAGGLQRSVRTGRCTPRSTVPEPVCGDALALGAVAPTDKSESQSGDSIKQES